MSAALKEMLRISWIFLLISSELAEKIRIAADDALSCGRITNDIYDLLIFDLEHLHK